MRRRRGDSGVTIVEASFALPILFLFVTGLVDLGMWALNSNQATNAARDGARAGILAYASADTTTGPDREVIVDAVLEHLPGGTATDADVFIECIDPDDDVIPCASARIEIDRVHVEVDWTWRLVTPIAGMIGTDQGAARGSASMLIVGLPDEVEVPVTSTETTASSTTTTTSTTTTPTTPPAPATTTTTRPVCDVRSITLDPGVVDIRTSDKPAEDILVTVSSSGGTLCAGLQVQVELPSGKKVDQPVRMGTGATHRWEIDKNSISGWTTGTGWIRVLEGLTTVRETPFTVG